MPTFIFLFFNFHTRNTRRADGSQLFRHKPHVPQGETPTNNPREGACFFSARFSGHFPPTNQRPPCGVGTPATRCGVGDGCQQQKRADSASFPGPQLEWVALGEKKPENRAKNAARTTLRR